VSEKVLQDWSDEELRAELQRRVDQIQEASPQPTNDPANLGDLPPGSWVHPTDDPSSADGTLAREYEGIMRLGLARMRELLAIPLDATDANYGASLRGINSAVSTLLTFLSKAADEMLRPPKQDDLPKLLARIKEEEERMEEGEKRLWAAELPELARELIKLSNEQVEELLAKRREHLKWRERNKTDPENKAAQSAKRRKPRGDESG
jgi:hypothetical protein